MAEKSFTPVSIRRRSAAQVCADAQDTPSNTPSNGGERLARRRAHHARWFEWLLGRRASQKHDCKAAGTRAGAAEAAGAAGGSQEADTSSASECGNPSDRVCRFLRFPSQNPLKMADLGPKFSPPAARLGGLRLHLRTTPPPHPVTIMHAWSPGTVAAQGHGIDSPPFFQRNLSFVYL